MTDAAADDAPILLDLAAPVATLTINRPAKRNALEIEDFERFAAALGEVHAAEGVRALIVTASGDKAFCAGAALGDVATRDWSDNPLTALCDGLEAFPLPTVCALNGGAYGGGLEIALACDFRIAREGVKAFVPPAKIGIHYEPAGIARALRVGGLQVARRLFLAVETFDDAALLAAGLVDRLVPADALASEARAYAETLAGMAPLAISGMKRTLLELSRNALDADAARARIAEAWASDDLREGLAAMKEKRAPLFRGR